MSSNDIHFCCLQCISLLLLSTFTGEKIPKTKFVPYLNCRGISFAYNRNSIKNRDGRNDYIDNGSLVIIKTQEAYVKKYVKKYAKKYALMYAHLEKKGSATGPG